MKKGLITIAILLIVVIAPRPASAQLAVVCPLCSDIFDQILGYVEQGLEYTEEARAAANTYAQMYKLVTTNPLTASYGVQTSKQLRLETQKWLMSGSSGNPLIIQNPEAYLKNSKTNGLRQQIAIIDASKYKSPATENIILSLIKQRRAEVNPGSAEVMSNAPHIIQDSLCKDNADQLRNIAESQASTGADTEQLFNDLYQTYCTGDPYEDPDLQKKLLNLSNSNAFFSWDNWLNTTGGDNDYTRGVLTQLEIDRRLAEKQALAQNDVKNGYLNDTKCIQYMDTTGASDLSEQDKCLDYQVIKPAAEVAELAKQVVDQPFQEVIASMSNQREGVEDAFGGIGDLFRSVQDIVSTVGQIGSMTGQIANNIGQIQADASALGIGGNPNTASTNFLGTTYTTYSYSSSTSAYVNTSQTSSSTLTSDGSTQAQRDAIAAPLKTALNQHKINLAQAASSASGMEAVLSQYKGALTSIATCVQDIQNSPGYQPGTDSSQISSFTSRASAKKSIYDPIASAISDIKAKFNVTNTYINNALTIIATTLNIQSLTFLSSDYQQKQDSGAILSSSVNSIVNTFNTTIGFMQKELANPSATGINDPISKILNDCNTYLNEVNARAPGSGTPDPGSGG